MKDHLSAMGFNIPIFQFIKMPFLCLCILSSVLLPSFNSLNLLARESDASLGKGVNKQESILSKYTLIGTACGSPINSFAVIKEKFSGKQELYRLGEHLENGFIGEIKRDAVIILSGDEIIELKVSIGFIDRQTEEKNSTIKIDHSDLLNALKKADESPSQIGMRPSKGQNKGLEIVFIEQGSIFEKLGLKKGDIIYEIDGTPIQNPELLSAIYDQIKNLSIELSLDELDFEQQLNRYGITGNLPGAVQKAVSLHQKLVMGTDMSLKMNRENQENNLVLSFYNPESEKEGLSISKQKRPFFHINHFK